MESVSNFNELIYRIECLERKVEMLKNSISTHKEIKPVAKVPSIIMSYEDGSSKTFVYNEATPVKNSSDLNTVKQLKAYCKALGLKGFSKHKSKQSLLEFVNHHK
jgi:hypothetical protein